MIEYCTWDETVAANAGSPERKADTAGAACCAPGRVPAAQGRTPPLSAEVQKLPKELQEWIVRENPSYEAIRKRGDELKKRKAGQST